MPSTANVPVLILPGFGGSGPEHWQTLWERTHPWFVRVEQRDWEHPNCAEWAETLERAVQTLSQPPVLVAHSLGCHLVAHWCARYDGTRVRAALLVAPPDPEEITFPSDLAPGFDALPDERLSFPSIVVASEDDPFGSPAFVRHCAERWDGRYVNVGALGHINADSGIGAWEQGLELLSELTALGT
jgi:uncharacterized protein